MMEWANKILMIVCQWQSQASYAKAIHSTLYRFIFGKSVQVCHEMNVVARPHHEHKKLWEIGRSYLPARSVSIIVSKAKYGRG
jgi:hypothetical protein